MHKRLYYDDDLNYNFCCAEWLRLENTGFDFNDAVQEIMNGRNISGKDGVLAPLVKQLVEAALEAELESHISQDVFAYF